jgi:hypothetical protein
LDEQDLLEAPLTGGSLLAGRAVRGRSPRVRGASNARTALLGDRSTFTLLQPLIGDLTDARKPIFIVVEAPKIKRFVPRNRSCKHLDDVTASVFVDFDAYDDPSVSDLLYAVLTSHHGLH